MKINSDAGIPAPCQFCDAIEDAVVVSVHRGGVEHVTFIECKTCKARGPSCDTLDDAVTLWNGVMRPQA